jgi:hypothetical protein
MSIGAALSLLKYAEVQEGVESMALRVPIQVN